MTRGEAERAVSLIATVLAGLLVAAGATDGGRPGADLRRAVGDMDADAPALVRTGDYPARLAACFALARQSGATLDALERFRQSIAGITATGMPESRVRTLSLGLCLVQQAQVLADTAFTSREDVERVTATANAAFDASTEIAADAGDQAVYRTLVSLHAAVTRDLTTRARPLPRVVTYTLPQSTPALSLATRLYGDGGRADELISENHVPHPLFMPAAGRALSA